VDQQSLDVCETPENVRIAEGGRGSASVQGGQAETTGTFEELLSGLAEERRKRDRCTRRLKQFALALFSLMVFIMVAVGIRTGKFPWDMLNSFSSMAGIIGITAGATRRQKQVTRSLAQYEDIRSIGPLAEALEFGDREIHTIAVDALIRLLPKLQASDAALLDDAQRSSLRRMLSRGLRDVRIAFIWSVRKDGRHHAPNHRHFKFSPELAVVILKALEQVGDERDLTVVQRIAEGAGRAGRFGPVRNAAAACLPYLQQRVDEQRARQTLLRAAGASPTPADLLLRPARGVSGDDLQLLRACLQDGRPVNDADTELLLAILSNLQTVGDARALPYVEQIAANETLSATLRDTAQCCLRTLRADSLNAPTPHRAFSIENALEKPIEAPSEIYMSGQALQNVR